jgi:hypothetical protein
VLLWWFFTPQLTWSKRTTFIPWRDAQSHKPYQDWVQGSDLICDSWGTIVKVQFSSKKGQAGYCRCLLSKDSLGRVLEVIRVHENDDDDDDESEHGGGSPASEED